MHPKYLLSTVALFLILFSICSTVLLGFGKTGKTSDATAEVNARQAIAAADQEIITCYRAVADADRVGANTTRLLVTLDDAGDLLSKSKLAYDAENFDTALNLALMSQVRLAGVVDEADVLKRDAAHSNYVDFMINVAGSIIGAVIVIICSSIVWFALEKRYEKQGV